MDDDNIPRAVRSEKISVCNCEVEVHVLEDGRRIVSADSLARLFEILGIVVDDSEESDR
jgi:hypothetical protein